MAALRRWLRTAHRRGGELSAGIIDSRSTESADTVGQGTRSYDVCKKVNGRKGFIVTDALGLWLVVCVIAASVQSRDGARTIPPTPTSLADEYGFAVLDWPGLPLLRQVRELKLVTSVLPVLNTNPSLRARRRHRLITLRIGDTNNRSSTYK